jgi:hypothetical protein
MLVVMVVNQLVVLVAEEIRAHLRATQTVLKILVVVVMVREVVQMLVLVAEE